MSIKLVARLIGNEQAEKFRKSHEVAKVRLVAANIVKLKKTATN